MDHVALSCPSHSSFIPEEHSEGCHGGGKTKVGRRVREAAFAFLDRPADEAAAIVAGFLVAQVDGEKLCGKRRTRRSALRLIAKLRRLGLTKADPRRHDLVECRDPVTGADVASIFFVIGEIAVLEASVFIPEQ